MQDCLPQYLHYICTVFRYCLLNDTVWSVAPEAQKFDRRNCCAAVHLLMPWHNCSVPNSPRCPQNAAGYSNPSTILRLGEHLMELWKTRSLVLGLLGACFECHHVQNSFRKVPFWEQVCFDRSTLPGGLGRLKIKVFPKVFALWDSKFSKARLKVVLLNAPKFEGRTHTHFQRSDAWGLQWFFKAFFPKRLRMKGRHNESGVIDFSTSCNPIQAPLKYSN